MPLNQMGNFTFNHVDQQDDLYKTKTAAEIKAALDSRGIDLKIFLNALVVQLQSTTADSGAKNLGVNAISGVTGANIQAVLEDLKLQINGAVTGSIPDGSITQAKLAFEVAANAEGVSIADVGAHFTSTNVEGALDELFTSANSVKTNVSGAIGSPATVNDTGAQLASKITTEKGRIASEVGDGTSADSLQYLTDRLVVRSDAIATAVNAKGVPATPADNLAQLAAKVGLITTGKKYASGTATSGSANVPYQSIVGGGNITAYPVTITGLTFIPTNIIVRSNGTGSNTIFVKNGDFASNAGSEEFSLSGSSGVQNANYYVNETGTKIPYLIANRAVIWEAWGD